MYTHPEEHALDIACRDIIRAACPEASVDIIYGVIIVSAPDGARVHVFSYGPPWIVRDDHSPLSVHPTPEAAAAAVRAILDTR